MDRPLNVIFVVAVSLLVFLALLYVFQRRMIYYPLGRPSAVEEVLPSAVEITFPTEDGLTLGGWYLPAATDPVGTVLVFNGNAGNRSYRAPLADALSGAGFGVMLFDYRGYGGNPGRPTEEGLRADARGAIRYLENRGDVDPGRIAYFGESLGSGVAAGLAAGRPPAALVLRSPFRSLVDVGRVHYPFLPVGFLLKDRYPAAAWLQEVSSPLLVIAGDRDSIVPVRESRALFEAAPMDRKRLVVLPGVGHNDYELLAGDRMVGEIVSFLREGLGAR